MAQPGELLAIMGGSGAGKTTLMNVFVNIDQTNIERTGHVTVNGDELTPKQMRRISAYVQQVDMFIGTLTVREQLQFSVCVVPSCFAGPRLHLGPTTHGERIRKRGAQAKSRRGYPRRKLRSGMAYFENA